MSEKAEMIKIRDLDYRKDRKLWYYDYQGELFDISMDTKQGYLVLRPDMKDNKFWLIKRKHTQLVQADIL